MREFMFSQVQESELQLLIDLTKEEQPADKKAVSSAILIPAFMLSELKRAFQMGFMIYVPFLVIDMLVASVLTLWSMFYYLKMAMREFDHHANGEKKS